ncbi:MAG TPA: TolC family protein [Methylomirabilota bacterium]|nr:TolC family protein [Methylomirabilota bacterium]
MTARETASVLLALALAAGPSAVPAPARAQGTTGPMPKSEPLPAPSNLNKFPTPEQIVGREMTLDEAVSISLDNAPKILANTGDYLASLQRVNQALAPLLPQLTGIGQYGREQFISTTTGARSVNDFGSASATASQLLWDFGKQWAAKDAAKFDAEAFRAAVELQKNNIAKLVKLQYFTLLFSQRLVTVNEAALDRAEINLRSAKGFFDVGTQPKSFVTRAEVDVANARVNLIRANNNVSLARVALNAAMGVAVNTPTQVKDILAYEHFSTDRDALLAEALKNRPDYVQIKAQAEKFEALVRQTFRDFFPTLTGSGTYGITGITGTPPHGSRSTSGFIDSGPEWLVGLTLNWTIFDGGGKIARYKEAKANVDAIKARVRDTELQIWNDVEQAYLDLGAKEESIGAAGKAVESAQENYDLARGRFDAGVANIIELTDAQLALTTAQSTEAQALSDYRIAIAQLELVLGRR